MQAKTQNNFLLDTTGAFLGKGIGNIANGFRKTFADETNIDDLQKSFLKIFSKMKISKENFEKKKKLLKKMAQQFLLFQTK